MGREYSRADEQRGNGDGQGASKGVHGRGEYKGNGEPRNYMRAARSALACRRAVMVQFEARFSIVTTVAA